ncbi:MAG: PAS domain S-box protein [Acidobacteriaceae bacterium]|jgi:PAS domain S-box-containing protein
MVIVMQPLHLSPAIANFLRPARANAARAGPSHSSPSPSLTIRPHWLGRLALAAAGVILATALRLWLSHLLGVRLTYFIYFPAVAIVASSLGVWEGLWTTFLSILAAHYIVLAGPQILTGPLHDREGAVLFLCFGATISFASGTFRKQVAQKELALEQLRVSEQRYFTEQRLLHEANFKLAAIVESSDDAIIGKDTNGTVITWNRGAEKIFGYTAGEMIGHSIGRLYPPGREAEEEETMARILRGETVEHFDAVRVAKDGRSVRLSLTVSPIKDAAGRVVGASKIARDITETRDLQRQLQQSQKMEAIGQLTGGIAHDFNNLLAIILGALELQQEAIEDNKEALHRWQVAHKAASRGAELTKRLLAFSSQGQLNIAPTSLEQSIHNTMDLAARVLGPEVRTKLTLDDAMPPVLVDPASLESALLNLIVNARDAMPKGGDLVVSCRAAELADSMAATLNGNPVSGAYACISVTDSGTGMPPEVVDRVFEPFFTTKERGRGTGLGLSMVYGFVKQSNGGIRIYSEPGYGTTITFYLPFSGTPAALPPPKAAEDGAIRGSGVVLIVDDEAELVEIAVTYLSARGYTVLTARDAKDALRIIEQHGAVDAMITDIVMGGGMDGMELAQAVRRISPRTQVVYSSGFPADALSERSLPLAGSLVLQKPYRLAELGASVVHVLSSA